VTIYEEVGGNLLVRSTNNWEIYRVWEFKTYRKFAEELYEVYEIVMLNVWLHVRVINFRSVLYCNCLMLPYNVYKLLFSPKTSAILAHSISFSSSFASR